MIKPILCLLVTLTVASAQRIILPNDKMNVQQRAVFKKGIAQFQVDRIREEPLFLELAQIATQKLADEVMLGNFKFATDNMYGRWKTVLANAVGGKANLQKGFARAKKNHVLSGIEIIDIQALPAKDILYVRMQKKKKAGVIFFPFDYTYEKLVAVPTKTTFKVPNPKGGKPLKMLKNSCQIAIYSDQIKSWKFIDGADLRINELRSLFPTVPLNFKNNLPKSGKAL